VIYVARILWNRMIYCSESKERSESKREALALY